ncbi:MAG: hypothetical protein ACR2MY_15125 [Candidatus Dormibacteria bacterium]
MEKISLRDSNFGSFLWKSAVVAMGGAAALGLQAVVPLPIPSFAANTPTFSRPVVSGIAGQGYEQDLRIDTQGRVYTSVPNGGPSGASWIWKSLDRGKTFKWVAGAAPLTGHIASCQGGGDTELATDNHDNLYFNILSLANFSTARSSDGGATFTPPNCTAVAGAGVDRQWYATDGDPTQGGSLYLAYDSVVQGSPNCPGGAAPNNELTLARSPFDGIGASAGVTFGPGNQITAPCQEGIMGNVEVSPKTHHILVPHNTDQYDQIRFSTCVAVPFSALDPSGLSCRDYQVTPAFTGHSVAAANFTTMAVDRSGTVYVAWAQADCSPCTYGPQNATFANITSDTQLYWSKSTDEGIHWTPAAQIPTAGLHNNVYPYMAAGDDGRVDIAYYGTAAQAVCVPTDLTTCHGPDSVHGDWSLFMSQTLNGGAVWSPPIIASERAIHRGNLQTIIGAQKGDRTLGDFLQMRVGLQGEANITYGDSTSRAGGLLNAQAMFVRQNGGSTVSAQRSSLCGVAAQVNRVFDPRGDANLQAAGVVGANQPNLDIVESDVSQPDAQHYQVRMVVSDLTTLAPQDPAAGNVQVWSTQWHVPSSTDPTGGRLFHAYMESVNGGAPSFWDGQNATPLSANGGNGTMTYPGTNQVTGTVSAGAPGVITISVPVADVAPAGVDNSVLYSVTASTMALNAPAETGDPATLGTGIGGQLFNVIDVAEPYDYIPGGKPVKNQTSCGTAPTPSPRPTASAIPGGGGGRDTDSQDEDNADDDQGVSDTEYELALPTAILSLVDPPDVSVPTPSVPPLP